MSHNKPGPMVDVLREILNDQGPLEWDELEDEIDSKVQEAVRHLMFTGEWERSDKIVEVCKYTVNVNSSQQESVGTDSDPDE